MRADPGTQPWTLIPMPFIYALIVLTACLVGCCLLTVLLFARQLWRSRSLRKSGVLSSIEMPHSLSPFDTSRINPDILRLRSNFIHALHSRPHPLPHRAEFLMSARQEVAKSGYFKTGAALQNALVVNEPRHDGGEA